MQGNGLMRILVALNPSAAGEAAVIRADQGFGNTSTIDGWLPLLIQLVAGLVLALAIARGSRRS